MDSSTIQIAIALISGGVIQALFNYSISRKQENRMEFEAILKALQEENGRLITRINELEEEVKTLQKELHTGK